jgi:hypothetical protein
MLAIMESYCRTFELQRSVYILALKVKTDDDN